MIFTKKDGTRLVQSRAYAYLSGHQYFYIAKSEKNDRTLIFDLVHEKGDISVQLTNITTGEVKFIKEPTSNRYFFHLLKGSTYQANINTSGAYGSYTFRLSDKDIKVIKIDDYHYLNDRVVFHYYGNDIYMYKDRNEERVGSYKNYQEQYKKPLKLMKKKSLEYVYMIENNASDEELSFLFELIYKTNRNITVFCYDDDFASKHMELVNKYHLDVVIKPSLEDEKPHRPYVIH